mmetsp:Transcript_36100/g.95888  ORF Transcript_36100/g.95888 Transcript_36100/m.95888 type:complete len:447 (-) Transcript_36100:517-1857(-)
MDAMTQEELKEAQCQISEEMNAALEDISVKALIEFRGQVEVSAPVQDVATAVCCIVSQIDDMSGDRLPPRTWQAVQSMMLKPGQFCSFLRRFPHAVDSGRVTKSSIGAAGIDAKLEDFVDEPVAESLARWLFAAVRYLEIKERLHGGASVSTIPSELGDPAALAAAAFAGARPTPSKGAVGRVGGATPSRGRPVERSASGPTLGARQVLAARSGGSLRAPITSARRRGGNTMLPSVPGVSVEDLKTQLQQLKRETSQMKTMENSIKWSMKRDEQRHVKHEKIADSAEIMNHRRQDAEEMKAQIAAKTKASRDKALFVSRERQHFKREVKAAVHDEFLNEVKEAYDESRFHSAWATDLARSVGPAERRQQIEAHLEQYQAVAEHGLQEQQRVKVEMHEDRLHEEQQQMELAMFEAQMEREKVMRSLEHCKVRQRSDVRRRQHILSRP